jgi:hypothetical protein
MWPVDFVESPVELGSGGCETGALKKTHTHTNFNQQPF